MYFTVDDPPPHYDPQCPALDHDTGQTKTAKVRSKKSKTNTYAAQFGSSSTAVAAEPETVIKPIIKLGYVGKAKGLLDILFERGWLDPQKKYTKEGSIGADGQVQNSVSIQCDILTFFSFEKNIRLTHPQV